MAKITKSSEAPEGTIKFSFGLDSFQVSGSKGYETDDLNLINSAMNHRWLEVKTSDNSEKVAAAEAKDADKLMDAREDAKVQHAEKDPMDAPAPIPNSIEELKETKGSTSKGDNK